jgi:hypothetical protein
MLKDLVGCVALFGIYHQQPTHQIFGSWVSRRKRGNVMSASGSEFFLPICEVRIHTSMSAPWAANRLFQILEQ